MIALSPNPGFALLLAALIALVAPKGARALVMLGGAFGALYLMFAPGFGDQVALAQIGLTVTPLRLDALSQVFGLGFAIAIAIITLFSLYRRDRLEDVALLAHAGGAITAAFAGDLISFIAATQLGAMAGVALAASGRTPAALGAAVRMLIWQGLAGLLLVVGAGLIWSATGEIEFVQLDGTSPGGAVFQLALLIMLGAPLAHVWVKDVAANTTPAAAAALAVFPLSLALYALLRAFPGEPLLAPLGAVMALAPLPFAAAAQDMRRAIAYGLISQAGVAMIGIGAATPLALAGAVAFTFACMFHNALAFMTIGFAHERAAGIAGGLARTMPVTAAMSIVAALSALAAPGFAGFVGHSVLTAAVGQEERAFAWFAAVAASAGAVFHIGLRAPFQVFFGRDGGARPADAPFYTLLAMGLAAFFIVAIGANPGWLYSLLPEAINYRPFDGADVLIQAQLVVFALLAFGLIKRFSAYPAFSNGGLPDIDWLYRKPARAAGRAIIIAAAWLNHAAQEQADRVRTKARGALAAARFLDRPASIGSAQGAWLLAVAAFLLAVLYAWQA